MTSFKYRPLDRSRNEIRLLRILPADDEVTAVQCELAHVSLDDRPVYEALSYTWGGNIFSEEISVDETRWMVTENLKSALLAMRDKTKARSLWVDAICINQSDLPERSYEVLRILSIYQAASWVCIWLGSASDDSSLAFDHLQELALEWDHFRTFKYRSLRHIRRLPGNLALTGRILWIFFSALFNMLRIWPSGLSSLAMIFAAMKLNWWLARWYAYVLIANLLMRSLKAAVIGWWMEIYYKSHRTPHPPPNPTAIDALTNLFQRPWWMRTWIIQEIAAAQKATIFCGPRSLSLGELRDAIEHITERVHWNQGPNASPYIATQYQKVLTFLGILELQDMPRDLHRQRSSLLFLINQFSEAEAGDPRDKVYALLGIAQDGVNIVPDYMKSVEEVFTKTAQEIIRKADYLDILRACQFEGKVGALPSWVPDWTVKQIRSVSGPSYFQKPYGTDIIRMLAKHNRILPVATFSDDSLRLSVTGIFVGKLTSKPKVHFSHGHVDPTLNLSEVRTVNRSIVIGQVLLWASMYIPGLTALLSCLAERNALGLGYIWSSLTYGLYSLSHRHQRGRGETQCHYQSMYKGDSTHSECDAQLHWNPRHWPMEIEGRRGPGRLKVETEKVDTAKVTTYTREAEAGDRVVFLVGAKVPFLIRKVEREGEDGEFYRVVGEASFGDTTGDMRVWEDVSDRIGDGIFGPEVIELV